MIIIMIERESGIKRERKRGRETEGGERERERRGKERERERGSCGGNDTSHSRWTVWSAQARL